MIDQSEPQLNNVKVQNVLDSWEKIVSSAKARIEVGVYSDSGFNSLTLEERESFHYETDHLFKETISSGDFVKVRDFIVDRFYMCSSKEIDRRLSYYLSELQNTNVIQAEVEKEDEEDFDIESIVDRAMKRVKIDGYERAKDGERTVFKIAEEIATTNRLVRAALRSGDGKQLEDVIYTRLGNLPRALVMQHLITLMGQLVEKSLNEAEKAGLDDELDMDQNAEQ